MKNQRQQRSIVLASLCLIGLTLALTECKSKPVPTEETPTATAPAVSQAATVVPSATAPPITPSAAPTATPTEEELVLAELERRHNDWCDASCQATREAANSYAEYGTPQRVTRPEWETLFPDTNFYVVPWVDHYGGRSQRRSNLFALHQGQWYDASAFDQLLNANGVEITDENRELVARALVLMMLPDYLEQDVVFSNWREVDWPGPFSFLRYNYAFTVWTKIQGLRITCAFIFDQGYLRLAKGTVAESNTGDYIDVPYELLPWVSRATFSYNSYDYWEK